MNCKKCNIDVEVGYNSLKGFFCCDCYEGKNKKRKIQEESKHKGNIYIDIRTHNFQKINTITIIRGKKVYDKVKCSECGLKGIRYGLSDKISVKRDKKCTWIQRIGKVRITGDYVCHAFGLKKGSVYDRCECPSEYLHLKTDVWVFSEERKEPIRLVPGEYEAIKKE